MRFQLVGRRIILASALGLALAVAVPASSTWKVGDTSLCGLLKLAPGGTVPAACSSAS